MLDHAADENDQRLRRRLAIEQPVQRRIGREPLNLFWFAHHTVLMMVLTQLPSVPALVLWQPRPDWSGRSVNSFFAEFA